MAKLAGTFSQLGPCTVLVAGDLFLDTYTIGKARRISPEAPVAVVQVSREEQRPGGAGNVVLNLISLGAAVKVLGRVGADSAGASIKNSLAAEGADCCGIITEQPYETPIKNRIIAENQQVVRVDYEKVVLINEHYEQQVLDAIPSLLEGVQVLAISDYGKGFLSDRVLSVLIAEARARRLVIIADPKGTDFTKYNGSTIIKPNYAELVAASGLSAQEPIEKLAEKVIQNVATDVLMVTRSEAGISLFFNTGERHDLPVRMREVKDVTGAGDTVLATLAFVMGNDLPIITAAQLSNHTAGIAIERFGCARVTLSELARSLLEHDVDNKIFDGEHLFALQHALKGHSFFLLAIEGSRGSLSANIFKSIHQLSKGEHDLILYIRDENPCQEFVQIMASLYDVDFILLDNLSVKQICEELEPAGVYILEGGECKQLASASELILV